MTSSLEELAAIVGEMQDRDAIWQCLLRYARGVDRFDGELIRSAFHPNTIDDHGKFLGGPEDFIEGAKRQHAEAHCMFAGMNRNGNPLVLNGGPYLDRLEKRDGEWRIAYRTVVRDWGLMDETPNTDELSSYTSTRAYLTEVIRDFMNECPPGRRDATDPSYRHPGEVSPVRVDSWERLNKSMSARADKGAIK